MRSRTDRFPGETPKYRAARNKLLKQDIKARREIEKAAAQRRTWRSASALAIVARSPIGRVLGFARERGWRAAAAAMTPEGRGTNWGLKLRY